MTFNRLYRRTALFIAALFLLMQGVSTAHAASHGSAPHDHDGTACAVSVLLETQAAVPAPNVIIPQPVLTPAPIAAFETAYISTRITNSRNREPPPRGPPAN